LRMAESAVPQQVAVREQSGTTPGERSSDVDASTWVPQAEAAARTRFSVSAVRKWRRLGLVAERKITSSTGMERVEVRLEDVLARAALQPERRRDERRVADTDGPERRVVLEFDDLEELFERLFTAEQRAERAEAEVASLRAQLTVTHRQTPGPRRGPDELAGQPFDQARQRPPEVSPPMPMDAPHEPIPPAPAIMSNVGSRAVAGQNPTVRGRPDGDNPDAPSAPPDRKSVV
jgi:hypothetical protein